jgi:hypothetical protein
LFLIVLAIAALLRLGALFAPVYLSDDLYRYLWDGQLVVEGLNPYAETPRDAAILGYGDRELLGHLNSPHYHSTYPPIAQGLFALSVLLEDLTGFTEGRALRLLFILADLIAIFFLTRAWSDFGCRPGPRSCMHGIHSSSPRSPPGATRRPCSGPGSCS